ncbi:MAG: GNAT family N-acetyltransferase [Rickettsiales bacterium]|nr:GNAT family N-acetyltransferase [Rickettsiales bacterium]
MAIVGDFEVRLAKSAAERKAVRKLRYKVFVLEEGARPSDEQKKLQEEFDIYDNHADYMIVVHKKKVVATYRIITREIAEKYDGFYTENEFNISKIKKARGNIAELSRACVAKKYRETIAINMLWIGLGNYILRRKIALVFGVASFVGLKPVASAQAISYIYYKHLAPAFIRAKVKPGKFDRMNILPEEYVDKDLAFAEMPPLLKGYLRLGAEFGLGVYWDEPFNCYDVFITMQTRKISKAYQKRFAGKEDAFDDLALSDGMVKATAKIVKLPFVGLALAANLILTGKLESE